MSRDTGSVSPWPAPITHMDTAQALWRCVARVRCYHWHCLTLSEVTPQKAPKNYRETFQAFLFRPSKISRYIQICSQHRLTNERYVMGTNKWTVQRSTPKTHIVSISMSYNVLVTAIISVMNLRKIYFELSICTEISRSREMLFIINIIIKCF